MPNTNTAKSILWPDNSKIVLRTGFLYVGQGSCILLFVRDGNNYRLLLIDSNLDKERGGINVPLLLKDLSSKLYAFVNTHPHDDHLRGISEISSAVEIENVWHSGHNPGKERGNYFSDLTKLIKEVETRNGKNAIVELSGTRDTKKLFDIDYNILAPADHVKDDISDEDAEARARRIHEHCAVLRFGKDPSWVLVTGDADLVAFREHITEYHKERLGAFLLDASHHGSRSFFKEDKDDEPYLDALKAIAPEFVAISAPEQKKSPHDHPHDDSVDLYVDQIGKKENVLHLGDSHKTVIFDIYEDGSHSNPKFDDGKLAKDYPLEDKKEDSWKTIAIKKMAEEATVRPRPYYCG